MLTKREKGKKRGPAPGKREGNPAGPSFGLGKCQKKKKRGEGGNPRHEGFRQERKGSKGGKKGFISSTSLNQEKKKKKGETVWSESRGEKKQWSYLLNQKKKKKEERGKGARPRFPTKGTKETSLYQSTREKKRKGGKGRGGGGWISDQLKDGVQSCIPANFNPKGGAGGKCLL